MQPWMLLSWVDLMPGLASRIRNSCTWGHLRWIDNKPIGGQVFMLDGWISSGRSLPLIFCIHVRSGPICWGVIYLAKEIIRWWYFTCKKPENIICDGILHVNMFHYFKIPYFTCNFFTKWTYNEYIGPYFLSHVVLRFSPSDLPEWISLSRSLARTRRSGSIC
jgi:hypothetical protein